VNGDESGRSWVTAVLAEYDAHRSEVLSEAQAQQQILALGATAVGLVVAGAFNVWDNQLLASVAFLGVVPLLCLFVLVQWVGRAAGLMGVGFYLQHLEEALRDAYPTAPRAVFSWEKSRAEKEPRGRWWTADYEWHDVGAIAIFALLAYGSIALGAYRAYDRHEAAALVLLVVETLVLTVIAIRFLHETTTVRDRVREGLNGRRAS
jgi:hypothetical protein